MIYIHARSSTSISGGNQVDGLPPVLSFEIFTEILNFTKSLYFEKKNEYHNCIIYIILVRIEVFRKETFIILQILATF